MNIELNPADEKLIREKVAARDYGSPSEVTSAALRVLREREAETARLREDIHLKIERGLEQSVHGEGIDGEPFTAHLMAGLD